MNLPTRPVLRDNAQAIALAVRALPKDQRRVGIICGEAIWQITAADVTMPTDNILAIAGASNGHFGLIVFGLGLSIPFVIFSSNLLSKLMDHFAILIYLGVAILGAVAGNMIVGDPFVTKRGLDPKLRSAYHAQF